jgi:YtkA-like protein
VIDLRFSRSLTVAVAIAATLTLPAAGADVRAKADIACQPTGKKLQYDCTIKLMDARTEEPLTGIDLAVGADMPSMPGAHNVRPVKAAAGQAAGAYQARLVLEMLGDWALRLDVSGRVRDRVIKVLRFEEDKVQGAPATVAPQHGTAHRKH